MIYTRNIAISLLNVILIILHPPRLISPKKIYKYAIYAHISLSCARIINPLTRNARDNGLHLSHVLTRKKKKERKKERLVRESNSVSEHGEDSLCSGEFREYDPRQDAMTKCA